MPSAARVGDNHTCPETWPKAHKGGPIKKPGEVSVKIGGAESARAQDHAACTEAQALDSILLGSPSIYYNGKMASRVDDPTTHGGKVSAGFANVQIGGPTAKVVYDGDTMIVAWGGLIMKGSRADVGTFIQMLNEDAGSTNAGRRNLASIVNDKDHPVRCNIGRGQDHIFVDGFTNAWPVDLNDLEKFPTSPSPYAPNETTRGELINHFLSERHDQAVNHTGFDLGHMVGTDTSNQVRLDLGQAPIRGQTVDKLPGGGVSTTFYYADGTNSTMVIDGCGNLISWTPP